MIGRITDLTRDSETLICSCRMTIDDITESFMNHIYEDDMLEDARHINNLLNSLRILSTELDGIESNIRTIKRVNDEKD